jgi:hypothetical protein
VVVVVGDATGFCIDALFSEAAGTQLYVTGQEETVQVGLTV